MKTFKIKQFTQTEGNYLVQLGNNTTHTFSTKIKMKQFFAETNRFLTSSFFTINELYIQAYEIWRKQMIISDFVSFDMRCRETLGAAENVLYMSWHKSGLLNGNQLSFIKQNKALDFIDIFIDDLHPLVIKRSDTVSRYQLDSLKESVKLQRVKLYNYARVPEDLQCEKEGAAKMLLDLKL